MTEKSKSGLVSATEDAPPGRLSTASSQAPVTSASRELDERVAEEVMKWTRSGRAWIDDRGHLRTIEPTSFGSFQPSTSIADAWLVWTYLVKHGWTIGLEYMKTAQGMQYRCDLHRTSDGSVVDAFATEAPLAICLAALRALDA